MVPIGVSSVVRTVVIVLDTQELEKPSCSPVFEKGTCAWPGHFKSGRYSCGVQSGRLVQRRSVSAAGFTGTNPMSGPNRPGGASCITLASHH